MADLLKSPLGCLASIFSAIVGTVAGFHFLWPLITRLLLLPYPGTSADNRMGAKLLALPIGVLLGAAIGFVIPVLVVIAFRFIESKRNEN